MFKKIVKRSKSSLRANYPKKASTIDYTLSPDQMYEISVNKNLYGIDGYEVPRQYFDYNEAKWKKKRQKILSAHQHIWPPKDWPRDKNDDKIRLKPKRITYIDELKKWSNSFYDPQRAESLIKEGNIDITEYQFQIKIDKKKRIKFLEEEKKRQEWKMGRPPYPIYKKEAILKAEEHKKKFEEEKKKDPIKDIISKYKDHPLTSRCDKVSYISEAIHIGEQVPFYNTYIPKDKKGEKKIQLFNPKKNYTLTRYPSWKYPLPVKPSEEHKKHAEEQRKEKLDEFMENKELKPKDLWINVIEGYKKLHEHGRILKKFVPEFKYKEVDQYKAAKENSPDIFIGPQQYWKMPKPNHRKVQQNNYSSLTDDKGNKIYYMDRKRTDKTVYTVGLRRSVY